MNGLEVTIQWGYWNGRAECRATLGDRTKTWQAPSIYVTPLQREEIPRMLTRQLLYPTMRHETTHSPPTQHTATTKPDTPRTKP